MASIFIINGCSNPITSTEADNLIRHHLEKIKEGNYEEAYNDYSDATKKITPFDKFSGFFNSIEIKLGKMTSYEKSIPVQAKPGFIFMEFASIAWGKMSNILYEITYEKGVVQAGFSVVKKAGILKIYGCGLKQIK